MIHSASGLIHDRRGAAAVEFAMVAPIFLALLFSILEAGYFFFVSAAVDQAAERASRLIRTGQAQSESAPLSREDFFQEVCRVVKTFGDCSKKLTVEVARYPDFAALAGDDAPPTCRDADDGAADSLPYEIGQRREIVRVRVCFLHRTLSPGLGLDLSQTEDGMRKLHSVTIFRNEPFSS